MRRITICWAVVALSLAWLTWQEFASHQGSRGVGPALLLATLFAVAIAGLTVATDRPWMGVVLMIASLPVFALSVLVVGFLAACGACNPSDERGGTAALALVFAPAGAFSFVSGIEQWRRRRRPP